jgi:preprotein translocase subunit YajC
MISQALATETATALPAAAADAPSASQAFMSNMGLILLMFVLFYMLLIRPQQKRLKAQQAMLGGLKVGDKVVTGGGLVGTITKLNSDTEVEVDLGNGLKVTALRYTLSTRIETDPLKKAA